MVTDNLGLIKQSSGENVGKWGDVLNSNFDRLTEMLNCIIIQSAADKKILHVMPTDSVGNAVIKTSIVQPKEIVDPSFLDIINSLIGTNDQSYPTSGSNIMLFGTLGRAIAQAVVLVTAGFKCQIVLHPGKHIVQAATVLPAGVSIVGGSKSNTEIYLQNATLSIKNSNSSIKNAAITGNAGSYVIAQPVSTTAIVGCELIDCIIDLPVYLDCKNIAMAIDLFAKGNEFNSYIVFVNTAGNIVTLGSVVLSGNYINKDFLYISDTIGDVGSKLSMMLHDGTLSSPAMNESDSLMTSVKNLVIGSTDYVAFQANIADLDVANYHLSGIHAAVSMGSPYPVMRNNIYA